MHTKIKITLTTLSCLLIINLQSNQNSKIPLLLYLIDFKGFFKKINNHRHLTDLLPINNFQFINYADNPVSSRNDCLSSSYVEKDTATIGIALK